jgi:hypothetical protein
MQRDVLVLETVTRMVPLGLLFWDGVTARSVSDGLVVVAHPLNDPDRRVEACANRHDVFAVRDAAVVVEVHDLADRFLPFTWTPLTGSPPEAAHGVRVLPLFSAPTRLLPGGMGVLRAQLQEPDGTPAAAALLEVDPPGLPPLRGMADQRGRVVVVVPYPSPEAGPVVPGSPMTQPAAGAQLAAQSWLLPLRAAYGRIQPANSGAFVPDLDLALAQPPAVVWADVARTTPLTSFALRFGREAVLTSTDTSGPGRLSELLIQPVP